MSPQPNTHVHGHPSNHVTRTPLISIKLTEKPTNTETLTSFVHTSTAKPHTYVVVSSVLRTIKSTSHDIRPPQPHGKTFAGPLITMAASVFIPKLLRIGRRNLTHHLKRTLRTDGSTQSDRPINRNSRSLWRVVTQKFGTTRTLPEPWWTASDNEDHWQFLCSQKNRLKHPG